jgi:hypothetical protein
MSVEPPKAPDQSANALHRRHHRRRHHYRRELTKAHGGQAPLPPRRPYDLTGTPYINPKAAAQAHAAEQQRAVGLLNGNVAVSPYAQFGSTYTPAAQGASAGRGFFALGGINVPLNETYSVLAEGGYSNLADIKTTRNVTGQVVTQVPVGHGMTMPAITNTSTVANTLTDFKYTTAMVGGSVNLGKLVGSTVLEPFSFDALAGIAVSNNTSKTHASTQATTMLAGKVVDNRMIGSTDYRSVRSIGPAARIRARVDLTKLAENAGAPKSPVKVEAYVGGMAARVKTNGGERTVGSLEVGATVSVPFSLTNFFGL